MKATRSMTLISTVLVMTAAGSSGTAMAGIDGGGITTPKPKVSKGPISGFGSIYVNGVRYDTDSALFLIDGALGSESDLTVGQVVSVLGTVSDDGVGTAYLVTFEDLVDGPVSTVDVDSSSMTVMGQVVLVDDDTVFALGGPSAGLDSIAANVRVEVSGYVDSQGRIVAASVRAGDATHGFDISGTVEYVDEHNRRLGINGLAVDFGNAGIYGLDAEQPRAGDTVEILGAGYDESGTLIASGVYAGNSGLVAISGIDAEIEGVITGFHSLSEFDLSGTRVRLTWGTAYVNDWVFGLSPDRKVQVSGTIDANGTLVADEIVFEPQADERLFGTVEAMSGEYLVVDNRLVRVMSETKYLDDSAQSERTFTVANVAAGDRVEIRGHGSVDMLNATLLRRVDNEDDYEDDDSDDEDDDSDDD